MSSLPIAPKDHARLMDGVYRMQRHIYDATRKYYLLGRDQLIGELAPPPGGTVLEIGCGTARNLILAARRWPEARFFGVDISREMLATARVQVARAGLSDRITLMQADATRLEPGLFGLAGFDRIFMSYTLSMIPDWQGALRSATGLLMRDGRLHVVDFGQQDRLPQLWRKLLFRWLEQFHVVPRASIGVVMSDLAQGAQRSLAIHRPLRGYAWAGIMGPAVQA